MDNLEAEVHELMAQFGLSEIRARFYAGAKDNFVSDIQAIPPLCATASQ